MHFKAAKISALILGSTRFYQKKIDGFISCSCFCKEVRLENRAVNPRNLMLEWKKKEKKKKRHARGISFALFAFILVI